MNSSKKIKYISLLAIALLLYSASYSQVNFFTSFSEDSLSTDFYKRNKKITLIALANFPNGLYGASAFVHNSHNRISYYFDIKTNIESTYIITGVNKNGDNGIQQKLVPYNSIHIDFGIAHGFSRNMFIYASSGIISHSTDFANTSTEPYFYTLPKQGLLFNIGIGAMYVSNKNYSIQAGADLANKSLNIGFGYTL